MDIYKMRNLIGWIRAQGKLPRDAYGQVLSVDDMMGWFGLTECLDRPEQMRMREELAAMIEAESLLEKVRLSNQLH